MAKKASAKHRPKSSLPQGRGATQRCTIYIFLQDIIYQLQFNYINSNQLLSERNCETSSGKTSSQSKVTLSWPSILGVLQNYGRLVAATGQKSIWSSLRGTEGYRSSLRDAGKTCVAIEGDSDDRLNCETEVEWLSIWVISNAFCLPGSAFHHQVKYESGLWGSGLPWDRFRAAKSLPHKAGWPLPQTC